MAFTFRGIGTLQYGQRDFRPDGLMSRRFGLFFFIFP